jgi:hypothetical protein
MKKPRSDSILLNLPEHQQAQLAEWLLAGMTYCQAQIRLKDEFNVSVSLGVFSNFYHTVCIPILTERRANLVKLAQTLDQQDQSNSKLFDQAVASQVKQRIFERCASPTSTPAEIKTLFNAMLKSRDRDIAEAKLDLQRRKSKLLESQAREKAKKNAPPEPPLTQEEREAIIADVDDILGIKRRTPIPEVKPPDAKTESPSFVQAISR